MTSLLQNGLHARLNFMGKLSGLPTMLFGKGCASYFSYQNLAFRQLQLF